MKQKFSIENNKLTSKAGHVIQKVMVFYNYSLQKRIWLSAISEYLLKFELHVKICNQYSIATFFSKKRSIKQKDVVDEH